MISIIDLGKLSKEEILEKADVFYAANRLNSEEYSEIVELVNKKYL